MIKLNNFRFPSLFSKLGKRLPRPVASAPLLLMLEVARHKQWLIAPESLYGKTFQMQIEDLGLNFIFYCDHGKFKALHDVKTADVSLKANAIDFFKLASAMEDADTLFFQRRLKIEGDTELGIAVKYWIDASERPAWLSEMAARLETH